MKNDKPLILVDGSSYLFRAYYALPPLTNSKGQPTGAIFGVINMLKKLSKQYEPEYIGVVFDPKGKTFRHQMYDQYKANRATMPDELRQQVQPLFAIIKALGYPLIIKDGYEADDVIATLTKQAVKHGYSVVISTGDKDLAQLVDEQVILINTMTDKIMDCAGVKAKFLVKPTQIIDYLALIGDTSDNIPGIPKVGPKTAAKWLTNYGSVDEIIKHADEIKGKVGENLRNHLDTLKLSQQLVTVVADLKLKESPSDLKMNEHETTTLIELFTELEFKNWLKEVAEQSADSKPASQHYETILDNASFNRWMKQLKAAKEFAFDTETTSIDAMAAQLVGISFAIELGKAAYVPLAHDYMGAPQQLDKNTVLTKLSTILSDSKKTLIGQNIKYDLQILANEHITVKNSLCDTMLASYVLNSSATRHDLNSLSLHYLGKTAISFEEVAGKGIKQLTFNQIELERATPYAAEDADLTLQLYQKLLTQLKKEKHLYSVFSEIDMPLIPILSSMERFGVLVDIKMLNFQSKELEKRIIELEKEAHKLAGHEFNLGSPKQLQHILYDKLKIPVIKKTPGGQPSTAENVLQDLSHDYLLPKVILEYRSLSKLKSTYTDRLPQQINAKTQRIHTSYNQAVTSTGRLSSNNPNLQNIPIRTEEGRKIRHAFIAPHGYRIVAADYSQVELRIIAHISKDSGLISAFERELDIHSATAAEVMGVAIEEVTAEQRRRAKAINFGLLYGMSSFGLGKQLGISRKKAQEYIDIYFQRYPKVHGYMEKVRQQAAEKGFVETLFGRRVYLPEINASNLQRRLAAERAAINAPMQGTAADIIKIAMINVDQWLKKSCIDAKMIMQVHDELVFEVASKDINDAVKNIRHCMVNAANLSVPLVVAIGQGRSWDEAH